MRDVAQFLAYHLRTSRPDCDHPDYYLARLIQVNGVELAVKVCILCDAKLGTPRQAGIDKSSLPLYRDNRSDAYRYTPCEVCGAEDYTELHHWAPWHLFPHEAHRWPTSWLCRPCHVRWHQIVTPLMGRRSA